MGAQGESFVLSSPYENGNRRQSGGDESYYDVLCHGSLIGWASPDGVAAEYNAFPLIVPRMIDSDEREREFSERIEEGSNLAVVWVKRYEIHMIVVELLNGY